ncbi:MAG: flavin monoamine oxidase family protein [Gaiellales bacterium]
MTPERRADHDAIIVGAGITGLAVATRLQAAGHRIRVLEARDRVGGRLLSVPSADGTAGIDLGAAWFWADETRVHALVQAMDAPIHAQHIKGDALFQPGGDVQRLRGNPIDAPAMRFQAGAQSLTLALANQLGEAIALACPARALRVTADHVEVEHDSGTDRARCAIVALPPALAVADLAFEPPLSDDLATLAARTPVWMGAMTKVVAEYATPFWRADGLAGAAMSYVGPLREVHDLSGRGNSAPALFGFAPSTSTPPDCDAIIEQLAALFGDAARHPLALHVQDRQRERWTSPAGAAQLADYGTYGDPRWRQAIHGRIWIGATETGPDHPGHIEGALATAEVIGREVGAVLARDT